MRIFSKVDRIILEIDAFIRSLSPVTTEAIRPSPGIAVKQPLLSQSEKKKVAGLMRVNLAGEICAQALYRAHALTARSDTTKDQMHQAAQEEIDHLIWCRERLTELEAQPSLLNPLWYGGSFFIGLLAGLISDEVSLGFVVETEKQVAAHLNLHLKQLSTVDQKSYAIIEQMYHDEMAHAEAATMAGGLAFTPLIQAIMRYTARVMTKTSYSI